MIGAVCVGDNCIDTYLPPFNHKYIGGNALNVAVHIRKAGCPAAYIGAVGDDADGLATIDRLRKQGIDVERIQIFPGRTAYTLVKLAPDGEREFVFEDFGPQPKFRLDKADLEAIGGYSLVHNTWQGGTVEYLPQFHRYPGLQVSLDYGERYSDEFVEQTIQHVDLAFFSMAPGMLIAAKNLAAEIAGHGPELVVVTLGSQGSLALAGGEFTFQPAIPVDVVDSLGAGDTYIATFLAQWLLGQDIAASMAIAAQAAAQTCTYFGAWENSEIIE